MFNQRKNLVPVARVVKSNGADGEVVFSMRNLDPKGLNHTEPVFICFDGSPVPFFIESLTPKGERKALVRLQGVKSKEDIGEIIGKDVYVEATTLPEGEIEEDGSFLVGWTLYDCPKHESPEPDSKFGDKKSPLNGQCRKIGEIINFIDIPGNPCIEVATKNGAAMIPLHEDLIHSIDESSHSVVMNIPDGLV